MPRHRSRQNSTHELTATTEGEISCADDSVCPPGTSCDPEQGVCVDGFGDPVTGETVVLEDEPVEYDSGGTSYIRRGTGERITRAPTVSGRGKLAQLLTEGDDITLTPLDPDAVALDGFEILSIDTDYGRRSRVGTVEIELGGV